MRSRQIRSAADNVAAAITARLAGQSPAEIIEDHVPLPFAEVEMSFEALAYAAGGMRAVRWGFLGPFATADWKEGPILLAYVAARIADIVRPARMPSVPSLAFGDDPIPAVRRLAKRVNLVDAVRTDLRLVSVFEGSDQYFVALVPQRVNLARAEANYARAASREAKRDVEQKGKRSVPGGRGTEEK